MGVGEFREGETYLYEGHPVVFLWRTTGGALVLSAGEAPFSGMGVVRVEHLTPVGTRFDRMGDE